MHLTALFLLICLRLDCQPAARKTNACNILTSLCYDSQRKRGKRAEKAIYCIHISTVCPVSFDLPISLSNRNRSISHLSLNIPLLRCNTVMAWHFRDPVTQKIAFNFESISFSNSVHIKDYLTQLLCGKPACARVKKQLNYWPFFFEAINLLHIFFQQDFHPCHYIL